MNSVNATTYDVAIVGAGIIGASCAFALAGEGLRVVLLDKQEPGREASWAAGGMLSPAPFFPSDNSLAPLSRESLTLYPEFVRSIESASDLKTQLCRKGATELFFGVRAELECSEFAARCRAFNIETEQFSADEARRQEPAISPSAQAAVFFPSEATVEPRALMKGLLEAASRRGVTIRRDSEVQSIIAEGDRCRGLVAADERVAAQHVVIAAGCFSQALAGSHPALAPLVCTRPVRGQMMALRTGGVTLSRAVRSSRGYVVPRTDGTIVAGSTLEEAGFEKKTTDEGLRKIRTAAAELAPNLAKAEVVESWSGLRPGTPDDLPILGAAGLDGLVVATGHFRNGILLAPITAKLVTDLILRGETNIDTAAFSPLRFARAAAQVSSTR